MIQYEIPLTPEPQLFTISLAGVVYQASLLWNYVSSNWNIDLRLQDGTPVVMGVPLVANTDLFQQYAYLNLGGQLVAKTDKEPDTIPTFVNLGKTSHLYFYAY